MRCHTHQRELDKPIPQGKNECIFPKDLYVYHPSQITTEFQGFISGLVTHLWHIHYDFLTNILILVICFHLRIESVT